MGAALLDFAVSHVLEAILVAGIVRPARGAWPRVRRRIRDFAAAPDRTEARADAQLRARLEAM